MKQYCRYCGHCIENGYNDYYCTAKDRFIRTKTACATNNCKDYGYCGIDIITGKEHIEKILKIDDGEQIKLTEIELYKER